jgi:O-antigen ligase
MIYLVIVNYVRTAELLRAMVVRALLAATIASAVAVLAFMGASLGLSIPGADLSSGAALDLTRPFGAFGTMVEPNILGSYCAAFLVLGYGLYLAMRNEEDSNLRRLGRWTSLTCAVALVVSFTRSAWIGALVGIVVLAVLTRRLEGVSLRRVLVPVAVVVGAAALVLLIPGTASAFLLYKITNILNPESPTVIWRLLTSVLALDQTSVHPIIGHGTFSFAPLVAEGTDFARYAGWRSIWISNFLLLALHDTGVIGLALWVALLWALIAPGWRAARNPAGSATDFSAPLTAAFVALLLPFLATTGFSLGYPWLLAGLLGAQAQLKTANENG